MRGGSRLHFVAGDRMCRRLVAHEERNARLRTLLDTGDDELPDVVALRLSREKDLARNARRLSEELAEAVARALAARLETVVDAHWEDRDMDFLQKVGRQLAATTPEKLALLTADAGGESIFAVVAGDQATIDLASIGARVAEMFDGRGGGRQGIYQGRARSLERRTEVLELLRKNQPSF